MKKTTWLLLALSLVAMLLVAGCQPTTPEESPSTSPSTSPTTAPTDKECPKPVSTAIGSAYISYSYIEGLPFYGGFYSTKLTITFDEPVTSGCIEDPENWNIVVKNSDRKTTEIGNLIPWRVTLSDDGKKVDVLFDVWESLTYVVKDVVYKTTAGGVSTASGSYTVTDNVFDGLICSEDDADDYATPDYFDIVAALKTAGVPVANYSPTSNPIVGYTLVSGPKTPKYADTVEWKLKDCVVADELGNACCDYSGSACCLEPTCAECEEGCPLGSEGSCL